ncbi:MAG: DUF167 domain-containing protein [Candidatus Altimarinota bacterium]
MLEPVIAKLQDQSNITIEVKVIPNSSRLEITQVGENSKQQILLKIKLLATPEKGRANEELIDFLSQELDLPKSHLQILSGHTSPHKIIKIHALQ